MTIPTEAVVAGPFVGNGVTTTFSFAFKIFADSDVLLVHTDLDDVDRVAELNVDYIVTRNADQDNTPGGEITWRVSGITVALPADEKVTITSQVPVTQATLLPTGGKWSAKTVERMIDKVTILVKQFGRSVVRSLRQPISDTAVMNELPNAANRRAKFLYFEDSEEAHPVAVDILSGDTPVSGFMATVLDDPDAATARATLGVASITPSPFMETLLDDTTAAIARGTLGVVTAVTAPAAPMVAAVGAASDASRADHVHDTQWEPWIIACSDEVTNIVAGVAKVKFRVPYPVFVGAVRASLSVAQASGSIFTVDINENGVTILSTKLTIDNGETTSTTAATPPVISDTSLATESEISIDVDQVGTAGAKGLKVLLYVRRTAA